MGERNGDVAGITIRGTIDTLTVGIDMSFKIFYVATQALLRMIRGTIVNPSIGQSSAAVIARSVGMLILAVNTLTVGIYVTFQIFLSAAPAFLSVIRTAVVIPFIIKKISAAIIARVVAVLRMILAVDALTIGERVEHQILCCAVPALLRVIRCIVVRPSVVKEIFTAVIAGSITVVVMILITINAFVIVVDMISFVLVATMRTVLRMKRGIVIDPCVRRKRGFAHFAGSIT
ncbi:MAG: hypothetical protein IKC03_02490 [Oscillospiraceae bacterium]|nr:hypothetical protein [Oscillospiraceae bacterium]